MTDLQAVLVLMLLLLGNAFFVAAEFAMVTARRDQIEPRAAAGNGAAKWALKGIENVSVSLAATQLGITACSLVIGAVGEPAIAHLIEPGFAALGVPAALVHPAALVLALVIVTFLHMVIGEMVPKNMAIARPAAGALLLGPVLHVIVVTFRPVIWLMNHAANLVVRYGLRAEPRDEVASSFTSDEVVEFVQESGREGLLDEDEIGLLSRALTFEKLTAADVALPAADLQILSRSVTVAELERRCAQTGYSRFPLRGRDDALAGYVHVKDALGLDRGGPVPDSVVRPLPLVPARAKLQQVTRQLQQERVHLALVQPDDGVEPHSVVMLEDVLEALVGEVRDATSAA